MSDTDTPVLVVGAGPSGLTMANELVRHGVAVRIVDQAPAPATTSRALVIQPRCLEIFEDMEVVADVLAAGSEAPSLNIVFNTGRSVRLELHDLLRDPSNYTEYQSLHMLFQDDTERILTAKLEQRGVHVERGLTVVDLNADEHGPGPEYREPTHDEFQAMLDQRLPVPATVVREQWVSRYRLHRHSVPRYRDGRVFLVGDAAHVHSPAGAQGMNTGIQDAYNLAWKLALVVRGIGKESMLDSYHAERHPIGERLLTTTDRFFAVIAGQNATARFLRGRLAPQIVSRVLARHSARKRFVGTLAQVRTSYPHSSLNRQHGADWQDAPAPGDRARQVDVVIDGTTQHLHTLLHGTRHTVLLFTGTDEGARPVVELGRIAHRIELAYPNLVRARVISPEPRTDHPLAVGDPDRMAHQRYGIDRAAAFVIRPDLHVGYRCTPNRRRRRTRRPRPPTPRCTHTDLTDVRGQESSLICPTPGSTP
ncbi:MAG TPA: FAD-dependent monooxygenase [Pseudonocardiaceae bacterium]|nr:FAD-dependent monooxygenase [Pseudonocardiaceae bacterium]